MKSWKRLIPALCAMFLTWTAPAGATPSSTAWTPMTLDIQPHGMLHIGVDNYFTVGRDLADGGGAFPTDAGLTLGILPFSKFQMEVGVDYLGPADHPWLFNAKAGAPEGALFAHAPAVEAGIFNVGTEKGVTDQNIFYGVLGISVPKVARISAGPYVGNGAVLRDAAGKEEKSGVMVGADRGFAPRKDADGEYNAFVLAGDYASGDNALGGGMAGLYYYFHRDVSLLVGPVWFNEEAINGKWKWSIQLDINHPKVFGH